MLIEYLHRSKLQDIIIIIDIIVTIFKLKFSKIVLVVSVLCIETGNFSQSPWSTSRDKAEICNFSKNFLSENVIKCLNHNHAVIQHLYYIRYIYIRSLFYVVYVILSTFMINRFNLFSKMLLW